MNNIMKVDYDIDFGGGPLFTSEPDYQEAKMVYAGSTSNVSLSKKPKLIALTACLTPTTTVSYIQIWDIKNNINFSKRLSTSTIQDNDTSLSTSVCIESVTDTEVTIRNKTSSHSYTAIFVWYDE